jgi:hypothetical protein
MEITENEPYPEAANTCIGKIIAAIPTCYSVIVALYQGFPAGKILWHWEGYPAVGIGDTSLGFGL